jgi:hypothetical protein
MQIIQCAQLFLARPLVSVQERLVFGDIFLSGNYKCVSDCIYELVP